jgi:hypothetical protein
MEILCRDVLRVGRPEFDSHYRQEYFSPLHSIPTASGGHPASYPIGTEEYPRGAKRQWREADYSPPSSATVKIIGTIPPLLTRLHGIEARFDSGW